MTTENYQLQEIIISCPVCGFNFTSDDEHIHDPCPACDLVDSINRHISSVLYSIIINFYSSFTFELDDKSKRKNKLFGFSTRQDRKHNLIVIDKAKEIHFKNFYLLLSSHIEAIIYETEICINKYIDQDALCGLFEQPVKKYNSGYLVSQYKSGNLNIKSRFSCSTIFVRHMANVIKHNASIIKKSSRSGNYLLKHYHFRENVSIYEQVDTVRLKYFCDSNLKISDFYEITCRVYVHLKDIVTQLLSTPRLKEKKLDVIRITNDLVDMQIRKVVSKGILREMDSDALMSCPDALILQGDSNFIHNYIKDRLKLLSTLKKTKSQYVIDFEIFGKMNCTKKKSILFYNQVAYAGFRVKKPSVSRIETRETNQYKAVIKRIYEKLVKKYGEEFTGKAFLNEFDSIGMVRLSNFIIDFYRFVLDEKKNDSVLIIKMIGIYPFRRWYPFLFGLNRPNT